MSIQESEKETVGGGSSFNIHGISSTTELSQYRGIIFTSKPGR
jgi:hypothetical protein